MRFFLTVNLDKSNAETCTELVLKKLLSLGGEISMPKEDAAFAQKYPSVTLGEVRSLMPECDIVISIGGDGTLIHAAKFALPFDKPVLGINTGRLGFLTRMEQNEFGRLERLFSGDYLVENRMMLELTYQKGDGVKEHVCALNDIVLSRGSLSRIIDLNIDCDGKPVSRYRADGLIFSTPTGSTAYSLSAGGPVVEPSVECIVMSPVCPHSLFSRTVVFAADRTVTVRTSFECSNEAYVTIDGAEGFPIQPGDCVTVRKSGRYAKLISFDQSFFEILSKKFIDHSNA